MLLVCVYERLFDIHPTPTIKRTGLCVRVYLATHNRRTIFVGSVVYLFFSLKSAYSLKNDLNTLFRRFYVRVVYFII